MYYDLFKRIIKIKFKYFSYKFKLKHKKKKIHQPKKKNVLEKCVVSTFLWIC